MVNKGTPFGKWPFGYTPFGSGFPPSGGGGTQHNQALNFTANVILSLAPKQVNAIRIFTALAQTTVPLKAISGIVYNFTALAKLSITKAVSKAATVFTALAQASILKQVSTTKIFTALAQVNILKQVGKLLTFTALAKTIVPLKALTAPFVFTANAILTLTKQINTTKLFTALATLTSTAQKVSLRTYTFTATALLTLTKQVGKVLSFTASAITSTVLKAISKTLAFTATAIDSIIKQVSTTKLFTALVSLTFTAQRMYLRTYTFTALALLTLTKQVKPTRLFTATAIDNIVKQVNLTRLFTAAASLTSTAQKVFLRTYTFTATAIDGILKQVNTTKIFTVLATLTLIKQVAKTLTFTASAVLTLIKQTNKTLSFTALAKLTYTAQKVFLKSYTFTATALLTLTKQAEKVLSSTATAINTIIKQVNAIRLFTATANFQAQEQRSSTGKTYNFTATAIDSIQKQVNKIYPGPSLITNGLLLWYWLGDGAISSGGSVKDRSTYNDTGTANGALTNAGISVPASGFGGSSYITLASVSQITATPGTSGLSIMGWVQTTQTDACIVSLRDAGSTLVDLVLGNNGLNNAGTGKASIIFRDSGGDSLQEINGTSAINDGNPHHVAFTFDTSQNMTLFVDGAVTGSSVSFGGSSAITPTVANSAIGKELANASIPAMNGDIGDVRIYNRALSNSEISSVYQSQGGLGGGFTVTSVSTLVKQVNKLPSFVVIATMAITKQISKSALIFTAIANLTSQAQKVFLRTNNFTATAVFQQLLKQVLPLKIFTANAVLTVNRALKYITSFTALAQFTKNVTISKVPTVFTALVQASSNAQKVYLRLYTFTTTAIASFTKFQAVVILLQSLAAIDQVFKTVVKSPFLTGIIASLGITKQANKPPTATVLAKGLLQKSVGKVPSFTVQVSNLLQKFVSKITFITALVQAQVSEFSAGHNRLNIVFTIQANMTNSAFKFHTNFQAVLATVIASLESISFFQRTITKIYSVIQAPANTIVSTASATLANVQTKAIQTINTVGGMWNKQRRGP